MAKKKDEKLTPEQAKEKSLKDALDTITKAYGEGAIMKLGENKKMNVNSISTGSLNLDKALGVGGVPKGRIIEIYGAESSGKTTLALNIIAEAQKVGGLVAFVDAEHALDPVYAKTLGVNIDELLISQPDTGEQGLDITDQLVRSGAVDVIVVDSVAALVPKQELEGDMTDQQVGLQARMMSKALRKITGFVGKTDTVLIFINQIREKIGGYSYGGQTTTSGGRALKFAATVRIEIKRVGQIKQGDTVVGNEILAKVTKNKVAPPFKEAKFSIMYGTGISKIAEVLDLALAYGICKKSGSWFSYGTERLGQGKINVEEGLKENKELFEEIKTKVLECMSNDLTKIEEYEIKKTEEIEEVEDENFEID